MEKFIEVNGNWLFSDEHFLLTERGWLKAKELQVFSEIKQQIITLVLKRTVSKAQETIAPKQRAIALINETINKLDKELL